MGNSPAITVTVTFPSVGTDLTRWDINPKSGNLPFTVSYVGYLFRQGINSENQADSGIVDGESVQLQILFPGGSWADVGPSVTTGYNGGTGYHGWFSGSIPLSYPQVPPGSYQFRVRYAGNSSKGLQGCESSLAVKPT